MKVKHLHYSKMVKKVMLNHLKQQYSDENIEIYWNKIESTYKEFTESMPYIGGRKNSQSRGVYDSIALFAYYEAVPNKPSLEEFEEMNDETFVPAIEKMHFFNMNWKWVLRVEHYIFSSIARKAKKNANEWVGNYHMEVKPFDAKKGIYYEFKTCPIADFAKQHGYLSLMPALCNPDYPMMKAMHGTLIRTTTCANGPCCDYWMIGDKNPIQKEYPVMIDKNGYMRNQINRETVRN